jgi:hypothetical protein
MKFAENILRYLEHQNRKLHLANAVLAQFFNNFSAFAFE